MTAIQGDTSSENSARLHPELTPPKGSSPGRVGLTLLRALWMTVAIVVIAFYLIGIPWRIYDLQVIHMAAPGQILQDLQLTAERAHALQDHGISLQAYSLIVVGSALVMAMPWLLTALLIRHYWTKE